jgi:microcystin-dependent protein
MAITLDGTNGITTPQINAGNIVGQVCFFGMTAAPEGFLKANGAAVSRTTYAALFAAIGTTYGAGDGSTSFNLPDLRGEFPRGFDDGRGVDSGRAFGSAQGDAIRNITGSVSTGHSLHLYSGSGASGVFDMTGSTGATVGGSAGSGFFRAFNIDASRQVPTASEARPRNVALLACIKF